MGRQAVVYAAVAAGGALGSVARYLCSVGALALLGPAFPWGTLLVNAAGSFLIGLYAALAGPGGPLLPSPAARHFVMAGFCGGFTTFSIFSLESLRLFEAGATGRAGVYVAGSAALWLASAWLGHRLARWLHPRAGRR
ncbi:fluoride efflux transporter FluC [Crenalkalicoccus roseus]|uniref:fluoride efflux transporter FluC n=1 Tax=Crenalkalicoccus roseus TaxID=1485588 RepID=UPI0010804EBC|nr:CrcB family protein [Crenalkalicoccus roseus]